MPTDVLARLQDALGASVTTDAAVLDATRED
jgi:glycolate oxidase